ncbi:Mitochondrial copper homeostasis protein [Tulasnella sp. JGI-2019a]|nr:Mitochondrial copper homeostasis protein [Tulasnella sp. JGI-2019a]KAG9037535.1 Mitochondrial copper homeostasis protein [Tulasnella sp. JGI-2019a]
MKCLDRNNYNKGACSAYFDAYKECKKAWMQRRKDDMRNGKNLTGPGTIGTDSS